MISHDLIITDCNDIIEMNYPKIFGFTNMYVM